MNTVVARRAHRRLTYTDWIECYCGKRGFTSRDAARRALAKAGNKIRVYVCSKSNSWHVTSLSYSEMEES